MKKVLITGASEGLGRCFAHYFAKQGYQITAVARNEARLQSLLTELAPGNHDYMVADLATHDGQQLCIDQLNQNHYEVLINNAGFSRFGDFASADIEAEQAVLTVNVQSVLRLSHAYLQVAQRGDAIINLSSLTYYLPTPVQASYVASKVWIASFSESLWYQARKQGVYVQALCPGVTKTEFLNRAAEEINHKSLLERMSGSPEQVVACSYRALQARQGPIVIPGLGNKVMALFMKLMPRKATVWMLGKIGDLA